MRHTNSGVKDTQVIQRFSKRTQNRAGLPAGQVLAMLTMLEVKGVVARLPGKRIVKK